MSLNVVPLSVFASWYRLSRHLTRSQFAPNGMPRIGLTRSAQGLVPEKTPKVDASLRASLMNDETTTSDRRATVASRVLFVAAPFWQISLFRVGRCGCCISSLLSATVLVK